MSGLIPKNFADVLFDTDPSEKLIKAIERGAPADKTLETDSGIVGLSDVPNYYGLSKEGRLLVDTKAPKDTYQFTQRGIIKSLHSLLEEQENMMKLHSNTFQKVLKTLL